MLILFFRERANGHWLLTTSTSLVIPMSMIVNKNNIRVYPIGIIDPTL